MKKLAIITTHPIQYQVPLFKNLSKKNIDTHVFFASKHGLKPVNIDPEFLIKFKWDINSNILLGYKSYFPKIQKSKINEFLLSFKAYIKALNSYLDFTGLVKLMRLFLWMLLPVVRYKLFKTPYEKYKEREK